MKKLYIQPNTQSQSMRFASLVCASEGGRTITNNAGLVLQSESAAPNFDPM